MKLNHFMRNTRFNIKMPDMACKLKLELDDLNNLDFETGVSNLKPAYSVGSIKSQ